MPANEIDLCISALSALKVSREAYASSTKHDEIRQAIAAALELHTIASAKPLCGAVADVIRKHG